MADPLTWLAIGSSVLGGLGSLFGSGTKSVPMSGSQKMIMRELYRLYRQGIDPKLLQQMYGNVRTALGTEGTALRQSALERLQRQGTPTLAREQVMSDIGGRQEQAIGQAISDIDWQNQQMRMGALQQMAGLAGQQGTYQTGQGYGQLMGAGLNYLLNKPTNFSDQWLDMYNKIMKTQPQDMNYKIPRGKLTMSGMDYLT